jgi:hypothetical protein
MSDTQCGFTDLGCHAQWIVDEVKGFFVWIAEQIFNALVAVLNAIPLPGWASSGTDIFASIPASVGYFLGPFDLAFGAAVVGSAYGTRFLIRRIPFIG